MNQIVIFSTHQNKRLRYVADFIFNGFTTIPFAITSNKETFEQFIGGKINYSHQAIALDEIQILPFGLLEEENHQRISPAIEWRKGQPILFHNESTEHNHSLPFDIFSAIFFMLSRYEEYNNPAQDIFDRFPAKESIAFKNNFLHLPIIDIWLMGFLAIITAKNPGIVFPEKKTQSNFTYDIDVAFAYKGRGFARQLGAVMKDILHGNVGRLKERFKVLANSAKDPFDNYDYIVENSINPIFFFLLHQKLSAQDRNISPKKTLLKNVVQQIQQLFPIGIHPSFHSSVQTNLLQAEKKNLEQIIEKKITKSRQHYLRFSLPTTYQHLIKNGILEEYSMGFAQMPGFRAGTCTPFYFFDLEKNVATNMKIFPLCIMESIFRDHIKIPLNEVLNHFIQYFEAVKKVKGHFICIWHNDTLQPNKNENDATNFRWLHEQVVAYIRSNGF